MVKEKGSWAKPNNIKDLIGMKKVNDIKKNPLFWWVNQGKTFSTEKGGGFLWAPKTAKGGRQYSHHIDITKANPGDYVLAYSKGSLHSICKVKSRFVEKSRPSDISSDRWQEEGFLLEVDYYPFTPEISKNELPIQWRMKENGPFDINGDVKMGYFYTVSKDFVQKVQREFNERFPIDISYLFNKENNLREPFESIFKEYNLANWSFDLLHGTTKRLGISNENDPRFSIVYRRDSNKIHFSFCSWLILGFEREKEGVKIQLPLFVNEAKNIGSIVENGLPFSVKSNEEQVQMYKVEPEDFKTNVDLKNLYYITLNFIENRFVNYSGTPYRNSHNSELGEAIFNIGYRKELFEKGLDLEANSIEPFEDSTVFNSDKDLISHIHSYISGKGFYYSKENVTNLFLALKTKPFVILSGISGTGKTQIVRYYAESLGATKDNGRFTLIPVRPDWSDGFDLLGYTDLKGEFQEGPLTRVLREASKPENREKPYFVLLDEMNLARVEYYFSDLLSIMESREWQGDRIVTDPINLDKNTFVPVNITIPDNVYIIGTVNMDETTHPFSQKVLDRANAIEFNDVKLDYFAFFDEEVAENDSAVVPNIALRGKFIRLKDAYRDSKDLIHRITGKLVEINSILGEMNASFGYRVRDEICFYMIHNEKAGLMSEDKAIDLQLHQKILPRLSGSDKQTDTVLKKLYQFCTNRIVDNDNVDRLKENLNHVPYPKSASKLADMIRRLEDDGFTSFWF